MLPVWINHVGFPQIQCNWTSTGRIINSCFLSSALICNLLHAVVCPLAMLAITVCACNPAHMISCLPLFLSLFWSTFSSTESQLVKPPFCPLLLCDDLHVLFYSAASSSSFIILFLLNQYVTFFISLVVVVVLIYLYCIFQCHWRKNLTSIKELIKIWSEPWAKLSLWQLLYLSSQCLPCELLRYDIHVTR